MRKTVLCCSRVLWRGILPILGRPDWSGKLRRNRVALVGPALYFIVEFKTESFQGILTKPDRLPQGDPIDLWKCILKGDKYRLGHGYFVTKQPSQAEIREVDYARARMDERAFFDTQSPWSTELVEFRDRFGTEALQEVLSKKLAVQILARYAQCPAFC